TPEEAIILASIVEKETGQTSERPRVAAVFVNRLNKGMRLESDPTIIYGLTKGRPLGRGIRRSELDRPNPYSTYQIDGLPPTPIANPGEASIAAVLDPPDTDELFFVADGTGGHVFATTLEEHNRNVARWRQVEAERKAAAPATGD
ncbi:MAG TPA: endolytic transglycosylase MltG, partial [Caulobacter sp.]|nr:endolytic transglycosylase MltG [Caulobacter sp.]